MPALDRFDLRILAQLHAQGDLTQAQLADKVHLSPTQCARRVSRLRQDGYIRHFAAVLDHRKLGLSVVSHTLVSLRGHEEAANAAFRSFIRGAPEVAECYAQTGDADYIVKIFCRDLEALSDFLERMIKASGGLASLRSSIALKEIKTLHEMSPV